MVRLILLIIGVLFLLAGLGGAVVEIWKDALSAGTAEIAPEALETLIDGAVKLLGALAEAPLWLALVGVGLLLILLGAFLPLGRQA